MRNRRLYYCAIQLTSIRIDGKSRFLLALYISGKGLVRSTSRRWHACLQALSRIVCCQNFHVSTIVVARQFEKCCTFRPTLGPNVATIICEIWGYWAILGDISKNL